jgi:hypothetical protein
LSPSPVRRQSISGPVGKSPAGSTLFKSTKAHDTGKWKSKEEKEAEFAAVLATKNANNTLKVKEPSERLRSYNAAMRNGTWQRQQKNTETEVIDPREKGWNEFFVDGQIPSIESLSLDANDKNTTNTSTTNTTAKSKPKTKKPAAKKAIKPVTDSGKAEEKADETVEVAVVDGDETVEVAVVDGDETVEVAVVDGDETVEVAVVDGDETVEVAVVDGDETVEVAVVVDGDEGIIAAAEYYKTLCKENDDKEEKEASSDDAENVFVDVADSTDAFIDDENKDLVDDAENIFVDVADSTDAVIDDENKDVVDDAENIFVDVADSTDAVIDDENKDVVDVVDDDVTATTVAAVVENKKEEQQLDDVRDADEGVHEAQEEVKNEVEVEVKNNE